MPGLAALRPGILFARIVVRAPRGADGAVA